MRRWAIMVLVLAIEACGGDDAEPASDEPAGAGTLSVVAGYTHAEDGVRPGSHATLELDVVDCEDDLPQSFSMAAEIVSVDPLSTAELEERGVHQLAVGQPVVVTRRGGATGHPVDEVEVGLGVSPFVSEARLQIDADGVSSIEDFRIGSNAGRFHGEGTLTATCPE